MQKLIIFHLFMLKVGNFFDQAPTIEKEGGSHFLYQQMDKGHGRVKTQENAHNRRSRWIT
ncbi:MAG: hypothetical protein QRY72_00570 [Candidatus Rhabdochlamydia sp.]